MVGMRVLSWCLVCLWACAWISTAVAKPLASADHRDLCASAAAIEERASRIPRGLLAAIAVTETGRWDSERGARFAWPWTINAEGQGHFFPNKAAAVAAARALQARGVRSMDVGCMQVNLYHHAQAFRDLNEAFDPASNAAYAARFLSDLHEDTGAWHLAAGRYHSATPEHGVPYRARVMKAWQDQLRRASVSGIDDGSAGPVSPFGAEGDDILGRALERARLARERAAAANGGGLRPTRTLRELWLETRQGERSADPTSRPGAVRAPNWRSADGEAVFAQRRSEVLQRWRDQTRAKSLATKSSRPSVTVLRGSERSTTDVARR
jgi:hypothetical protein